MSQTNSALPICQAFFTRDGSTLYYRYYPSPSNLVMILLHGISEDSKYLFPLAKYVASNKLASVYTPDLRGYGENPIRRGDVDYIGQIEDDLADLIMSIKVKSPKSKIVIAGHSAGGGTAIRFMAGENTDLGDASLLLAPHLGPGAPTEKPSDGTINVNMRRLVCLSILNSLGIRKWHHLPVLKVNRPEELRHGSETLELSFRLIMSRTLLNYKKQLKKLKKPALVVVGHSDEVFRADQYEAVFSAYTKAKVKVIPNENHDGVLSSSETHRCVKEWLLGLNI